MNMEEFDKLPAEQKQALLAKMKEIEDGQAKIKAEADAMKTMSIADFKGMIEETVKSSIKSMTQVDRKHFAFPGIGKIDGDLSEKGKFIKTVTFLKALVCGDVQVCRTMSEEVRTKANLSEGTNTSGGFLVPEEFAAEILRFAPIYGVARRNARIVPMTRDVMNFPAAGSTELEAEWVNEASQIHSTDPNFRQVVLTLNKLAAIPKVTNELLEDANVNTVSYLAELIAESFAKQEDQQAFNGAGSPFTGVLVATGVPTTPLAGGTGFICLSYSDLVNIIGNLYSNALPNAKFYLHRTMAAHVQGLITTAGAPIFNSSALNEILGFAIERTEILPGKNSSTAQTDATAFAIFGDLRRALMIGEKGAITMKMSDQATVGSDNLFEKDMQALRVIERIAMGVALPSAIIRIIS